MADLIVEKPNTGKPNLHGVQVPILEAPVKASVDVPVDVPVGGAQATLEAPVGAPTDVGTATDVDMGTATDVDMGTATDARLTGIETQQLDDINMASSQASQQVNKPVQPVTPPKAAITEDDIGFFGKVRLTDKARGAIEYNREKIQKILESEATGRGESKYTVSDADVLNRYLGTNLVREGYYTKDMSNTADNLNSLYDIPIFESHEEANSSVFLRDDRTYYVSPPSIDDNVPVRGSYHTRKSRADKSIVEQHGYLIRDILGGIGKNLVHAPVKSSVAFVREAIRGGVQTPAKLLGDIWHTIRKVPMAEAGAVAVDTAAQLFTLRYLSSSNGSKTTEEDSERNLEKFNKKYNTNANNKELKIDEANFEKYMEDFDVWLDDLPSFYGTDSKKYFMGRVGETFGEEFGIARFLAWRKFRLALKIASDGKFGGKEFFDADELAKALNITPKEAKIKLEFIANGMNDPKVYAAYKFRELDMALSFAVGSNSVETWLNDEKNGVPLSSSLTSVPFALEMGTGFSASYVGLLRQAGSIKNKGSFRALTKIYGVLDMLGGADYKDIRSDDLLKNKDILLPPNATKEEIKIYDKAIAQREKYKDQDNNRKYAYLRATGFTKDQYNKAKDAGTIDQLVAEALTLNELGPNFSKFLKSLDKLDSKTKEHLRLTLQANFDALTEITIYAKDKGIHIGIFLEDILDLGTIHDAKIQLSKSQGSSWKSMYDALHANTNIQALDRNAKVLREQIRARMEGIKDLYGESDLPNSVREFLGHSIKLADHMTSLSRSTNYDIASDLATEVLAVKNRGRNVVVDAVKSLMPKSKSKTSNWAPFTPIEAAKRAKELFSNIKNKYDKVNTVLWDRVTEKSDYKFDANDFVTAMQAEFDEPDMLPQLQAILKDTLSGASVGKLIGGMKERFFKGETIDTLIDSIAESARPIDGSFFNKDVLKSQIKKNIEEIASDDPEVQFQIVANAIEKMGLVSNELTMLDIKLLNSHLGRKGAELSSSNPRQAYLHTKLQDILHRTVLENENLSPPQTEAFKDYHEAIRVYREYSNIFKRGTLGEVYKRDKSGDPLINPEAIIDALIQDRDSVVASSETLEKLLRRPQINKKTGQVEYVDIPPEDLEELGELISDSLHNSVKANKMDSEVLRKILDIPFLRGIIESSRGKSAVTNLEKYRDDMINENVIPDNEANSALKQITQISKDISDDQNNNIKNSLVKIMTNLDGRKSSAKEIAEFFFNPDSFIRLENLTEIQIANFSAIFEKNSVAGVPMELVERISKRFSKESRQEVLATPFEALFILTEGFKRVLPDGTKIGEEILDNLRNIIAHGLVDALYSTSTTKIIESGKKALSLEKVPELARFHDLLGNIRTLTEGRMGPVLLKDSKGNMVSHEIPALFTEDVNRILRTTDQAVISHYGDTARKSGDSFGADVPTPVSVSSRMSRMWSWVRGFVGIRWILGESGISNLRKRQAKGMLEVLTNENTATLTLMATDPQFATAAALKGNLGPALRVLSIISGLRVIELEKLFQDPDDQGEVSPTQVADFLKNGELNIDSMNNARNAMGAMESLPPFGSKKQFEQREKGRKYTKEKMDKIREEFEMLKKQGMVG